MSYSRPHLELYKVEGVVRTPSKYMVSQVLPSPPRYTPSIISSPISNGNLPLFENTPEVVNAPKAQINYLWSRTHIVERLYLEMGEAKKLGYEIYDDIPDKLEIKSRISRSKITLFYLNKASNSPFINTRFFKISMQALYQKAKS